MYPMNLEMAETRQTNLIPIACHMPAMVGQYFCGMLPVVLHRLLPLGEPGCILCATGLQGHPEFTDKYMEADLKERMATGNLPKEVAEAALRDLKEHPVTPEAWRDMQKLLKTFLKVDHEKAEVYDLKAPQSSS